MITYKLTTGRYDFKNGLFGIISHLVIKDSQLSEKQQKQQHLHDAIPPLDGQTMPDHRQKIQIFA